MLIAPDSRFPSCFPKRTPIVGLFMKMDGSHVNRVWVAAADRDAEDKRAAGGGSGIC